MRLSVVCFPVLLCLVLIQSGDAQVRGRSRIRTNTPRRQPPQRVQEPEPTEAEETADYEEDNTPEPASPYYSTQQAQDVQNRIVLVASDDEYNGAYARPTPQVPRARADYTRPAPRTTSSARTKDAASKETVQTIRNYSKVNDDGSFTFGYEAADGSFKEETRGTDCVVRGKYGYIDPDGNKREFTYVSGNPCDPNNPDNYEEEAEREEETNEPENVPANFPRRPLRPTSPTHHTTTHSPTTVFQNQYTSNSYNEGEEIDQEQPAAIQYLQPQRSRVSARPQHIPVPEEVAIRQRPRITVETTSVPQLQVISTDRPTTRATQPPATTYRPAIQFFTQKAPVTFTKPPRLTAEPITKTVYTSTHKPIDFAAEFQKFQQENGITSTTPRISQLKTYRPQTAQKLEIPNVTPNPIYETQLVFDPASGQIDSSLFPQNIAYRIPFIAQQQQQQPFHPSPQIVLEPLQQQQHQQQQQQQQTAQPIYQRPLQGTRSPLLFPQFSQQVYHKDHENLQVLSSQQLFAQQQELQQQQLHHDRIEAAKRHQGGAPNQIQPNHRFQLGQPTQQGGFFYQPSPINSFLR